MLLQSASIVHNKQCPATRVGFGAKRKRDGQGIDGCGEKGLQVACGGVVCLPWAAIGDSQKESHETDVVRSLFVQEGIARAEQQLEHVRFIECTPRYPIKQLIEDTSASHRIVYIIDSAEQHGHPAKRRRLLAAMLPYETVSWHGPETHNGMQQEWSKRFHRKFAVNGDSLMLADTDESVKFFQHLASVQKTELAPSSISGINKAELLAIILPGGYLHRIEEWRRYLHDSTDPEDTDASMWIDADNYPAKKGASGGPEWPVLMRSCNILRITKDPSVWRLASGMEHIASLGFHCHPKAQHHWKEEPVVDILRTLKPHQQKSLAGNGMNLITQGAFMAFVLANVQKKRHMVAQLESELVPEHDFDL